MKQVERLLQEVVSLIDPELMVEAICRRGGFIKLETPKQAKEIKCPDCGSSKAYYNLHWKAWCCLEEGCVGTCIGPGCDQSTDSKEYSRKILTMEQLDVPDIYWDASFNSCDQDQERKNFLLRWSYKPEGFVLLAGLSGRGKTYASCCCLDAYRKTRNTQARFVSVSELYYSWRSYKEQNHNELGIIEKFSYLKLLVLDDIGLRTPTDAFLEFLYIFINERMGKDKGTIITTNLTSSQMNERLGDALTSRITSGKIFRFEGKDKRLVKEF